jgi:hypothetical protein
MPMATVVENLEKMKAELQQLLEELVVNHSSIYRWNDPSSGFLNVSGDCKWKELGPTGRQIQSKLLEQYRRFNSMLRALLREQPQDTLQTFAKTEGTILATIEQNECTWSTTTEKPLRAAKEALAIQHGLVSRLYDSSTGQTCYVPDTNALLYNPDLETWRFKDIPSFSIILTPTVLSELDSLKINHRNEQVREKAEKLIRQIKEYARRGDIHEGAPLLRGISSILAIAIEPRMEKSLPWLDPSSKDDRFIASVIEVMHGRSRSPVITVTRDINVQNKAAFARMPFVEPPDQI